MTDQARLQSDKNPTLTDSENLDREAMLLLVYFRALSLEHQDLTLKLLRALQEATRPPEQRP